MTKKILLLDDDAHFRNIMLSALADSGHTIIQATGIREASNELKTGKYDLLVVDGNLPDGDGVSFIESVRAHDASVAIIFVSAYWRDTASYRKLSKQLKVNVVMHKPIIPSVLMGHVDRLLGAGALGPIKTMAKPTTQEKLAKLAHSFGEQLPKSIAELSHTLASGRSLEAGVEYLVDASRKAHMLRGTAATYGFPGVTTEMGRIEDTLSQMIQGTLSHTDAQAWTQIESALALAKEHTTATLARVAKVEVFSDEPNATQVLAITTDEAIVAQMTAFGRTKGISLAVCDAATAARKCEVDSFDVIFCQIDARSAAETFEFLHYIRRSPLNVRTPVILIAERGVENLDADNLVVGSATTLYRPLNLDHVNTTFAQVLEQARKSKSRIMIVDDDVTFINRASLLLGGEGYHVQSFDDTAMVMDILPEIEPDMLFLDVDIAGVSGFDVCRRIRESADWKHLPVVFVTAQVGWDARRAAFECGGDDYLAKPIVNAELILKGQTWVERGKARRHQEHLDAVTGLPAHSYFAIEAQALMASCVTANKPFTLALIHIEDIDKVNEEQGPAVGDLHFRGVAEYLKAQFSPFALRGRWSGNTFVIAFTDARKEAVEGALDIFVSSKRAPCKLRAACASTDGRTVSLYKLANEAKESLHRQLSTAIETR